MKRDRCPNFNHGRSDAPVRFCSMCGAVVNKDLPTKTCGEEKHAQRRLNRSRFCVDCGEQLIK